MQQLSVSELVRYLSYRLSSDDNLKRVEVCGEISGYCNRKAYGYYFSLKDEYAAIRCVLFFNGAKLDFEPKIGDKVIANGYVDIYENSGDLQLRVNRLSLDGQGNLFLQFEKLKKRLGEEGLFNEDHKIEIPASYPQKIAVLVGQDSAAMSDVKTAFMRRWPICQADYYPVLVQGEKAPADIIEKLLAVDRMGYDAIILCRGGGSYEDLFCFNDESLARCIYDLDTFIITGIGHEQDFTLADFVADKRAATPTAAVELITPRIEDVYLEIDDLCSRLDSRIVNMMKEYANEMSYLDEKLRRYSDRFATLSKDIDHKLEKTELLIHNKISDRMHIVSSIEEMLRIKAKNKLFEHQMTFKRLSTLLEAYSSQNILKKGYTIVFQDERIIKNRSDLQKKEFEIRFNDGNIKAIERD